jgi:hypothetical protein
MIFLQVGFIEQDFTKKAFLGRANAIRWRRCWSVPEVGIHDYDKSHANQYDWRYLLQRKLWLLFRFCYDVVGALQCPILLAPLNDSGPIVWPSLGYVSADGTKKLANGPRLPHAITYNGYVYVFYQDDFYTVGSDNNNLLDVGDRRSGLKVMRAWLPNIESGNWLVYYEPPGAQGGFTQPALPAGFSNYGQGFFSTPGPLATPLFGRNVHNPAIGSSETKSFAVAQAGPNLFVGAEWYTDYQDEGTSQCPGKEKLALRTSSDLINWSNRLDIYGCLDPSSFQMDYAELVDAGSTSNTQIDPSNFYIVGSYHNSDGSFSYYSLHEGLVSQSVSFEISWQ